MKSPVRENRPPGSVRGALGNWRPYLDKRGLQDYGTEWKSRNWERRKQKAEIGGANAEKLVRSEKTCVSEGESPSSLEARLPEFGTKVMNGKV